MKIASVSCHVALARIESRQPQNGVVVVTNSVYSIHCSLRTLSTDNSNCHGQFFNHSKSCLFYGIHWTQFLFRPAGVPPRPFPKCGATRVSCLPRHTCTDQPSQFSISSAAFNGEPSRMSRPRRLKLFRCRRHGSQALSLLLGSMSSRAQFHGSRMPDNTIS